MERFVIHMRPRGLSTLLRLVIKLNIDSPEASLVAESILRSRILPRRVPTRTGDALNLCYSLIALQKYQPQELYWSEELITRLNAVLDSETTFTGGATMPPVGLQLDIRSALQVVCSLKLEAPEIFARLSQSGV